MSVTEAEWQSSTDFWPMHAHLWEVARHRPRKYRLVAYGICRRLYQNHPTEQIHHLLDQVEAYADDPQARELVRVTFEGTVDALGDEQSVLLAACDPSHPYDRYDSNEVARVVTFAQDRAYYRWLAEHPEPIEDDEAWEAETRHLGDEAKAIGAQVLREVFGNPFRSVLFDRNWLTPAVLSLAWAAYDDRHQPGGHLKSDRLAILSDALVEAGCTDTDILGHLRSPGPHFRGCWPLDRLLEKE
jgi:hypothetical protein